MINENLTNPAYHSFLPPYSREKRIELSPRLYTQRGDKIHLDFLPLRPGCENNPKWKDWNCYRSILSIGWPDCQRLMLPTLECIFPVTDPINGTVQEKFEYCSANWIAKADWERWTVLVRESLPDRTAEEASLLRLVLGWMETALTYTSVIVAESSL